MAFELIAYWADRFQHMVYCSSSDSPYWHWNSRALKELVSNWLVLQPVQEWENEIAAVEQAVASIESTKPTSLFDVGDCSLSEIDPLDGLFNMTTRNSFYVDSFAS